MKTIDSLTFHKFFFAKSFFKNIFPILIKKNAIKFLINYNFPPDILLTSAFKKRDISLTAEQQQQHQKKNYKIIKVTILHNFLFLELCYNSNFAFYSITRSSITKNYIL